MVYKGGNGSIRIDVFGLTLSILKILKKKKAIVLFKLKFDLHLRGHNNF